MQVTGCTPPDALCCVRCSPDLNSKSSAKCSGHRTHTTGRSKLCPVPSVWCLTLTEPGCLHTGHTGTASGASGLASGARDFSKIPTSAIENMHFIFSKSEGERNPSSLYPSNSTSFSKCANTTMCKPTCACVLAFSQSFSSKELS